MFFTTLTTLFTYTDFLSPIEVSILLVAIFCLVHFYTPEVKTEWPVQTGGSLYQYLLATWLGEAPLKRAFWPFFILVNGVFYYIDYRVMNVTYTIASWKTVHGMLLLPSIWWITSVWRCSGHTQFKLASSSARAMTLFFLFECFLRWVISTYYPNTFFDCRLLIMEYGDCF